MNKKLSKGKNLPNNQPQGLGECILDSLEKLGVIPVDIQIQILQEKDEHILKAWAKLASNSKSIEQFIQEMQHFYPINIVLLFSHMSK